MCDRGASRGGKVEQAGRECKNKEMGALLPQPLSEVVKMSDR